ncbi:hypothetical protein ACK3TF_001386 [Chlorella vulgaris]
MRFNSALLVALLVFGVATRVQATGDAALEEAIANAVRSVISPSGGVAAAAQSTFTGVKAGLNTLHTTLTTAYANAGVSAEAAVSAFEAQYCKPAAFKPSEKKPATFAGHAMEVVFSMGECVFEEAQWVEEGSKVLNCTEPSITYTKTPANFTSKYHTAPAFKSKECKVKKEFGESVEKVLFVFDGTQAPDMNSLIAKITEEVKGVLSTVGNGAQDLYSHAKSTASSMWGGAAGNAAANPSFNFS